MVRMATTHGLFPCRFPSVAYAQAPGPPIVPKSTAASIKRKQPSTLAVTAGVVLWVDNNVKGHSPDLKRCCAAQQPLDGLGRVLVGRQDHQVALRGGRR